MKLALILFGLIFCVPCFAEKVEKAILIEPETVSEKEKFTWNKWETENFIILSIDKDHGLSLKSSIESIKDAHAERWGINKSNLSAKCKLICVRDPEMLERFFGVESPRAETRKDIYGKTSVSAIWIDFDRIQQLPSLVAMICSSDGSAGDNNLYVQRGISLLSLPAKMIKSELSQSSMVDFSEVLSFSSEKWFSLSPQERSALDRKAALICLMLRKEFGQEKFLNFLSSSQDQDAIIKIYGFRDLSEFNSTLNRYSQNISNDIIEGKTPDSYVTVKEAKK